MKKKFSKLILLIVILIVGNTIFIESVAAQNGAREVKQSYLDAFGRQPKPDELKYWMGNSYETCMTGHRDWLKRGNEMREVIIRSYQAILSRAPSEDEINYWKPYVLAGKTYRELCEAHADYKKRGGK